MATRKEQKERLRQQRLEAERRAAAEARRRLVAGYFVAGLLALATVAGLIVVIASGGGGPGGDEGPPEAHIVPETGNVPDGLAPDGREGTPPPPLEQGDLEVAAEEAGCDVRLGLPDEGNSHITPNDPAPDYGTNPPTSGDHIVTGLQTADGAYLDMPQPVTFVHSLEHGRVEIQYDPDLPEEEQLAIKGVFDESPAGMLMFPNPKMPYEVAVTAWTNLVGCKQYSDGVLDVLRDFRDIYRGQGPEAVAF
jgi:Protein of unknown function (DUF3105)